MIGLDVDQGKVAALREGRSHIEDIPDARLAGALERCMFTTRFVELHEADAILVCVPTPLTRNREPDLGPLLSASRSLAGVIRRGQTIILESTTFPGTTREHLVPLLEESGLQAGEDFALAFSPERVDPGRTDYTLRNTPKVVGGLHRRRAPRPRSPSTRRSATRSCASHARGRRALQAAREHLPLGQHRARQRDGDARRPHGHRHLGGRRRRRDQALRLHALRARARAWAATACPVDPFYLTWKAREYDLSTEFIELAGKVNQQMPYFCLEKAERALNDAGKPVKGSRILIVGVSYKAGVGDMRESPALKIIRLLRERGADVAYHDPHVPELRRLRPAQRELSGRPTAWTWRSSSPPTRRVDHRAIAERAQLTLDLRGVTRALGAGALQL